MGSPLILKIILTDGTSQRLTLSSGPPESIEDLIVEVKRQCCLEGNFRLQFMDSLFGNEFLNLTSISEIEDKGTIKVIDISRPTIIQQSNSIVLDCVQDSENPSTSFDYNSSFMTDRSIDTDVLPSESTSSRSAWPAVFKVPKFPYDAELKLQQASMLYNQNGTVLIPDPKLKSAILDGLVQEILVYKVYVSDKEMDQVAQSLIKKHPCLTERGSSTGYGAWKMSLKYKLSNYRTHLRKLGCPEVTVNSLKNKPAGRCSSAFGVKKAKRAEVNFCPPYPTEETQESLEAMRNALLLETKKRNNRDLVKRQMEKTFAYRRHEVVRDAPMVEAFMSRWPGLFDIREINAEFKRITTIPLHSKFFSQLDLHCDNLRKLFKRRGGQLGQKLRQIVAQMDDCEDVDVARECVIKGLCIYMGEDPAKLIHKYVLLLKRVLEPPPSVFFILKTVLQQMKTSGSFLKASECWHQSVVQFG
ncbi:PREDICTED: uncharacterized protein LOC106904307 isoform X2 [Poecilia mexicana]|uniref:uncharacterized protein LOC106904307 isoform X2 n=1 Tax=Poecilia mexicana TaxID=48701 RepID=UPI00072D965C|nr:PREDICTED: uncharacterized protein LOC106904307 isoform X2 [Poecilia mexicana]XP_016522119.1 PREDICTED: uncharacterized protein LOC107834770 isoform X2 [Poecilia formosa]